MLFKLYLWEWLIVEVFAVLLFESLDDMLWIELIWKMIWSNKVIFVILWQLFPGYFNLLFASFDILEGDVVVKLLLVCEGANVLIW